MTSRLGIFFFLVCVTIDFANAMPKAAYSLKGWDRLNVYTSKSDALLGQDHAVTFEQTYSADTVFSAKAQIYGYAGNAKQNLIQSSDRADQGRQFTELWLGDAYAQFASGPTLFRIGYQQISWQEGFAASYTNFINSRDGRTSVFENSDQIFRSAPLANLIWSGEHLSAQLIYIPFSQFDIRSPASRWGSRAPLTLLPGQTVEIGDHTSGSFEFRPAQEFGSRVTWAGSGLDFSAFAAHLKDRQGYFSVSAESTFMNLKLTSEQDFINPVGVTSSATFGDYVARAELLRTASRRFNTVNAINLSTIDTGETAATLGLDSPGGTGYSFSLQHSISMLDRDASGLFRRQNENLSFASVAYTYPRDAWLRISMIYVHADQTLSGRVAYRRPVSKRAEIEFAFEASSGPSSSLGAALKDLNRAFTQFSYAL